jgi:shikimate kinase
MNLILCGMMGAGKTTVGAALAKQSGYVFYDTDAVIVERYGKIADIFACYGEAYFRAIETNVVRELACKDKAILSVGGGLVLKQENVKILKDGGKIIYLCASLSTLTARLSADKERPLLHTGGESLQEKLTSLLKDRAPIYEKVADCIVDVDGKTPEEIAGEIQEKMLENKK